jgi:hypothetical protein
MDFQGLVLPKKNDLVFQLDFSFSPDLCDIIMPILGQDK